MVLVKYCENCNMAHSIHDFWPFSEMMITPDITSKVPMLWYMVNLSSRNICASTIVEIGPTPPIIAALFAPILLIPSEIRNDGSTVAIIAIKIL